MWWAELCLTPVSWEQINELIITFARGPCGETTVRSTRSTAAVQRVSLFLSNLFPNPTRARSGRKGYIVLDADTLFFHETTGLSSWPRDEHQTLESVTQRGSDAASPDLPVRQGLFLTYRRGNRGTDRLMA